MSQDTVGASPRTAYVATHHWVPNFGANLQALATARALGRKGIDVQFVDFRPADLIEKYEGIIPAEQLAAHEAFVSEHLPLSPRITTLAEFEEMIQEAPRDLFVTGSDAVFRLDPFSQRADLVFPNPYWLCGAEKLPGARLAALSPSAMGADFGRLPETTRSGIRAQLENFGHVSVRDAWSAKQLRASGFTGPMTEVPDPVFSLGEMVSKMREERPGGRPYILVCPPRKTDSGWAAAFTELADAAGYDTVSLPLPEGHTHAGTTHQPGFPLPPLDWMRLIAGAEGYVGVRFHPVVVSLLAGIPVVAFDMYHSHPLQRHRSKTWLLLREVGMQRHAHSIRTHRFLTPKRVLRLLERQRAGLGARKARVDALQRRYQDYVDLFTAPTTTGAAS